MGWTHHGCIYPPSGHRNILEFIAPVTPDRVKNLRSRLDRRIRPKRHCRAGGDRHDWGEMLTKDQVPTLKRANTFGQPHETSHGPRLDIALLGLANGAGTGAGSQAGLYISPSCQPLGTSFSASERRHQT